MLRLFFLSVTIQLMSFYSLSAESSPDKSLERLLQGNERYIHDKLLHPDRTQERREELTSSQAPFATIVGCSDSRVSPEIIFDQGIGDLFVVRVAGNVVGPLELDSIDFSAAILGSSIILVLGHEKCGAVNAVLNRQTQGIEAIAKLIEPAVAKSRSASGGNPLENAVKENVLMVVNQLKNSKVVGRLIQENKLKVAGGYYHLGSGEVELISK